ncbi:MAG: ASKHA domain-containing protein [Desulfatibacillaceae bacterium]
MPTMIIQSTGQSIALAPGESVLEALKREGLAMESPCDGNGICGQCLIRVKNPGSVPETPHDGLGEEKMRMGFRLACRLVPDQDIEIVSIPLLSPGETEEECRILSHDSFDQEDSEENQDRDMLENVGAWKLNPSARIRETESGYELVYAGHPGALPLPDWKPEYRPTGLAVDIGTTTMVASLLCLETGEELSTASCLNPQTAYGHDVMTRIQKGSDAEGLEELAAAAHKGLKRIIMEVCKDSETDPRQVVDVVLGGNTTMLQLAGRVDPEPLGRTPFNVGLQGGAVYAATDFGMPVNPAARLYIPPIAHAFVGSDVSAGLLACSDFFKKDSRVLFLDVGTNGEMGLSANGEWTVTSTAAGPAFEGAGLSCGMRARVGALEAVSAEEGFVLSTIGDAPVKGVCGSGVIDLVAALLETGAMEFTGRMVRPGQENDLPGELAGRLEEIDGQPAVRVGEGVYFTQKDVRQVQLAKSAIRTAVDMLIEEGGNPVLDAVILSGGFGHSLRPVSLEIIGMIPPGMAEKVVFAGNTSLLGSLKLLADHNGRKFIQDKMTRVRHVHLVDKPEYMDRYVMSMEFDTNEKTDGSDSLRESAA